MCERAGIPLGMTVYLRVDQVEHVCTNKYENVYSAYYLLLKNIFHFELTRYLIVHCFLFLF